MLRVYSGLSFSPRDHADGVAPINETSTHVPQLKSSAQTNGFEKIEVDNKKKKKKKKKKKDLARVCVFYFAAFYPLGSEFPFFYDSLRIGRILSVNRSSKRTK